ncbi:hypothetical protein E2542_SST08702 [Spatholobus suberectus]|nr:hypothetical protein E2542_SST08702 [Spatholobus suberectus]
MVKKDVLEWETGSLNSGSKLVKENVIDFERGTRHQFYESQSILDILIYQPTFPKFNLQAILRSVCRHLFTGMFTVEKSKFCL